MRARWSPIKSTQGTVRNFVHDGLIISIIFIMFMSCISMSKYVLSIVCPAFIEKGTRWKIRCVEHAFASLRRLRYRALFTPITADWRVLSTITSKYYRTIKRWLYVRLQHAYVEVCGVLLTSARMSSTGCEWRCARKKVKPTHAKDDDHKPVAFRYLKVF